MMPVDTEARAYFFLVIVLAVFVVFLLVIVFRALNAADRADRLDRLATLLERHGISEESDGAEAA